MAISPALNTAWRGRFERDGFAILENVLTAERVLELIDVTRTCFETEHDGVLRRNGEVYGVRDLVWRVPAIRLLSRSREVLDIIKAVLGPGAFAVRGLFFDKTPATNWNLPWHQDLTIAVRARRSVDGFGPWTVKAGIPHVHAPAGLLARMVTIRLHFDDCDMTNGPMRVLPGSHASGKLDPGAIAAWSARADDEAIDCLVPAGGAVVMRPLLLHASASGIGGGDRHRRVIHVEYAAEALPSGLEWFGSDHQASLIGKDTEKLVDGGNLR